MAVEALVWDQLVGLNIDQDIFTASPNNTVNCVQIAAIGSQTNIGLALSPKGTGYLSVQVPDSAITGGNIRGTGAIDLQTLRTAANEVASGAYSAVLSGRSNRASGDRACVINGNANLASNISAVAGGTGSTSSGVCSLAVGESVSASGYASQAFGISASATAARAHAMGSSLAHVAYSVSQGSSTLGQLFEVVWSATTTTNSAVEMLTPDIGSRYVLRANSIATGILHITGNKTDGSAVAAYSRQVSIKRVANATTIVGTVNIIGTDEAAGTSIAITADDTNEALKIEVTGVASETWRWTATFRGHEKTL